MDCYVCQKKAAQRCPRCGNAYCRDHGEDPSSAPGGSGQALCADCLNPINAAPSGTFFRASLLLLLVGSVLALWLLIRPPGADDESGAQAGQPSGTRSPVATSTARPSVAPTGTPGISPTPGGTPGASPTPGGTPTPVPSPTPEPSPFEEYTVQQGDSLSSIAQQFGTTADELARINGITDPNTLDIGQKLQVPRPASPSPTPGRAAP